jgi:hypothetical protein
VTEVMNGQVQDVDELSAADEQLLRELSERARTGGLKLTGEGGLPGTVRRPLRAPRGLGETPL